jgi:hypothetical protein
MKKLATFATLIVVAAVMFTALPGCSDDDSSNNNNNNNTTAKIYVQLKANAQYVFKRQDLDSNSVPIASTTRNYTVVLKGNGGLIQGAYNDWFYRIGTDAGTQEKDTLLVRTETGSASGTSFTRNVQVYGFSTEILKSFSDLVTSQFGGTPPNLPGPTWDILAMYQDEAGNAYDVGKEWTIGNPSGQQLSFTIGVTSITVTVTIKGKLDSKTETIMMGSTAIKAWKTTVTVTATLPFGSPIVITMSAWFSDNPDGQVKILQNSAKFVVPLVGTTIPIPGEIQEITSYVE